MLTIETIIEKLKTYDGPPMRIMEVCGSHTDAVAKNGIPSILSEHITLLSGPGCPVCVTTSSYIDRLVELAREGQVIVTFGDLIRVPGSKDSLSTVRGEGCRVEMVYSPLDVIAMAEAEPETDFVFAAVGFETTAPVYALLVEEIVEKNIENVRLLTALKTMPEVITQMLADGAPVDGFLAPGHVSVVTGCECFRPIAERYGIPFAVSGFTGEELLSALYSLITHRGEGIVTNCYPSVVTDEGNVRAMDAVRTFFQKCPAAWRGLGEVPDSGYILREEYRRWDAGSEGLIRDEKKNPACCCDRVLTGRMRPYECPLYGRVCQPMNPQGACMVSTEGSCYSYYINKRKDG
ncbi:MAG: hydrogenase formation protein HypD [Eubacterium sp.]|nr:hydrogenase formation protein HypD [Eubacterium sp.]